MGPRIVSLLLASLAALSLFAVACGPQNPAATVTVTPTTTIAPTTPPSSTTAPSTAPTATAPPTLTKDQLLGLGLTEAEVKILQERGVANVTSADVAAQIAGFKVAVPAYVPEGFVGGKFSVSLSGAGLPEEMKPKFNNTNPTSAL